MISGSVISLPSRWRRSSDPEHGVLVTARSPQTGASGVLPLIRLEIEPVHSTLQQWREDDLGATATRRTAFELHDKDDDELHGWEVAYRRFGFRRGDDELVCEQWAWLVDGVGFTLTCTVGRADYPDYCDLFEAVADTFEPG